MRSAKHGIRVLGLAVLALLGVGLSGAQAALPGESTVGTFLANLGVPTGHVFTGEQLGNSYLLVQARNLKIECTGLDVNEGVLNNSTDGKVTVSFLGCLANNHKGEMIENCEFKELKTIKVSALLLPILHGEKRFVLFEPLEGTQLAVVSFKPNQGCVLPLNNPVTGAVVAEVEPELKLEGEQLTLLFSELIQFLSGDVLKYGSLSNTSYLNGTADIELAGFNIKLGVH